MEVTLLAERESAPLLRRLLSRWLSDRNASQVDTDSVLLAAAEACSNAIEHAYPPDRRNFRVTAACRGSDVIVTVRDWGNWRPPRGENRGRGMVMMEALVDSVDIDPGDDGTTVTLRHHLTEEPIRTKT
jgi:anti-sigma regulatory factor (Ser/Thr protein kinase)